VSVISATGDEVVVQTPSGTPGTVDVTIVSETGSTVVQTDGFTYLADGEITAVTPSQGQLGTVVTIEGTSLRADSETVSSVTLAGVDANILSVDGSRILRTATTIIVSSGRSDSAVTGDVIITGATGATITGEGLWSFTPAGAISAVTPNEGQIGTRVVVDGAWLRGGSDTVEAVLLAATPATVVSENETQVVVVAGRSSSVNGDVIVVGAEGSTVIASGGWTYLDEGSIDAIEPNIGQRGTLIEITGSSLFGGGS